ncbi:diacylglycerol/polyprenol kinase family protein [Methanobacterium sp. ACI-7]|uniref:diacylglycerol/polyprenol kinase family protein n=1 Tax=unclassified Methanobacterium TaxID=2627676 RepID=UPI0039C2CE6E
MKREYLRQLIHASGIFIVFLSWFLQPLYLILIWLSLTIFVTALFKIDKKRNIFFFSFILRNCKREDNEKGFIYFFVGILLTLCIFQFNMAIANAAIIILLFGDSVSNLVGKKYGNAHLPLNKNKTITGTSAFIVVAFIGALTQVPTLPALFGAFFGALAEAYSPIDDNIPIPLISALAMSITIYFI